MKESHVSTPRQVFQIDRKLTTVGCPFLRTSVAHHWPIIYNPHTVHYFVPSTPTEYFDDVHLPKRKRLSPTHSKTGTMATKVSEAQALQSWLNPRGFYFEPAEAEKSRGSFLYLPILIYDTFILQFPSSGSR